MLVVDGQDKIGQLAVNSGVRQNEIIHIKTTFTGGGGNNQKTNDIHFGIFSVLVDNY